MKKSRIIDCAKNEITGFNSVFKKLEQQVILGGMSASTIFNFGRCIAKWGTNQCRPTRSYGRTQPSKSYFKHTVYALRFLIRIHDLENKAIKLASLKKEKKPACTF